MASSTSPEKSALKLSTPNFDEAMWRHSTSPFSGNLGRIFGRGRLRGNTRHPAAGQPGAQLGSHRYRECRPRSESTIRTSCQHTVAGSVRHGQLQCLQTRISRRFANGFQFQASYTFSKAIAYNDEADSTLAFNIPDEFGRNRSATGYDRTHNFEAGWTAELPFGKGKPWAQSGVPRFLLGGWQLNSTFSAYSGTPFTVTASRRITECAHRNTNGRPDASKGAILGGTGPGQSYFNPTAFAPVTAVRFGTSGLNTYGARS